MSTNKWNRKYNRIRNNTNYAIWLDTLCLLCLCRYEWINLPSTCNEEYLEKTLFERGRACMFDDSFEYDELPSDYEPILLTLGYTMFNNYDIYGFPTEIQPFSKYTGTRTFPTISYEHFEICWNNRRRLDDYQLCVEYASRISDIQRSIDINLMQQKMLTGFAVETQNQKDSITTALNDVAENNAFIIVDKNMWKNKLKNGNNIESLTIGIKADYIVDKLQIQKNMLINEFLNRIGLENSNMDKRERVNSSETNGNIGELEAGRNIGLITRKDFCRRVNEKWGLNVDVRFRSDLATLLNKAFNEVEMMSSDDSMLDDTTENLLQTKGSDENDKS